VSYAVSLNERLKCETLSLNFKLYRGRETCARPLSKSRVQALTRTIGEPGDRNERIDKPIILPWKSHLYVIHLQVRSGTRSALQEAFSLKFEEVVQNIVATKLQDYQRGINTLSTVSFEYHQLLKGTVSKPSVSYNSAIRITAKSQVDFIE